MARTIAQIQSQIMAQITADPTLGTKLTSPSQVAIYNVFAYIVATALSIEEQLRDIFQTEIESDIANAPPGTPQWIVKQVLAFQYNAGTPQYVAINNFVISYPIVNPAYQVVAQCAVVTNPDKVVQIKVAPLNPAGVFDPTVNPTGGVTGPTMKALTSYLDLINFAGVEFTLINALPDQFLVGANIYYDGQYAGTIQTAVNAAINNYLATLPFNGLITLYGGQSDPGLIAAIMNVPGVEDVEFNNVSIRPYTTTLADATVMVSNRQTIYRNNGTFSGRAMIDTANQGSGLYTLNFNVNS